jgi:hypothetical protein
VYCLYHQGDESTPTRLHGATFQKALISALIAVRTRPLLSTRHYRPRAYDMFRAYEEMKGTKMRIKK